MVSDARRTMILLDPTVDAESREITLAKRPAALDGLVVGLLDNGKLNAGKLLELVAEELRRENNIASVVAVRKPNASRPAPDDVLDQLASKVDVAISGIGD